MPLFLAIMFTDHETALPEYPIICGQVLLRRFNIEFNIYLLLKDKYFASPSCSKIICVDKYLLERNLMGGFLVKSTSSYQTDGYLGPFGISTTGIFWEKS